MFILDFKYFTKNFILKLERLNLEKDGDKVS